jgi:hypothetical protein
MPVTLPARFNNASSRPADNTKDDIALYNVVQQLNGVTGTGIGYVTGSGVGSTVAQATNRSTGVTLNNLTGTITGQATSLAASTAATFTVTNSFVAAVDTVVLSIQSGPTAGTSQFFVTGVSAGSFNITAQNMSTSTADTGAPVINFTVIKGSAN